MSRFLPPYSLSGNVGQTLDATPRPLAELEVTSMTGKWQSIGPDSLRWFQPLQAPILPALGQEISLLNGSGERVFAGRITERRVQWRGGKGGVEFLAANAWEWLRTMPLTSVVSDEAGNAVERPIFRCPTQALALSISQLVARMIALGFPMQLGTVAAGFSVPRMTFPGLTAEDALTDALKWLPDAGTRVDYAAPGLPVLHVTRRPSAALVELNLLAEEQDILDLEMNPRLDQRPTSVEIQAATLDAQGRAVFSVQTAGTPGGERRQQVVVSGPEANAVLPVRTFDSATVRSYSTVAGWFAATDKQVANYVATWGANPVQSASTTKAGSFSVFLRSGETIGTAYTTAVGGFPSGYHGMAFGADGKDTPPDWLRTQLGLVEGYLVGEIWAADPQGVSTQRRQDLIDIFGPDVSWLDGTGSPTYYYMVRRFQVAPQRVWLLTTASAAAYSAGVTVYKEADFDFIFPPADLAANLFSAQDWLPYEGLVRLGRRSPLVARPGDVLSAAGGLPEWTSARALIRATELDLVSGQRTLEVGSPSRTNPATLMDRFRRAANDNVTA
jgi:hypothetical protein